MCLDESHGQVHIDGGQQFQQSIIRASGEGVAVLPCDERESPKFVSIGSAGSIPRSTISGIHRIHFR
jgi:hypothetical protein